MKNTTLHLLILTAFLSVNLRAALPGYLDDAFRTVRWVAYSPTGNSPDSGSAGSKDANKKREEIKKDLTVLQRAGFGGIVTYGSDGLKGEIPHLAHTMGINHVILGVYNPLNEEEIKNAKLAAPLVDGYCIGNEGLGRASSYSLEQLKVRMDELRKWSGKPVATSEQIEKYFDHTVPGLIDLGDWIFPNVHPWFHRQFKEPEASRWTKEQVDKLRTISGGKTILCKEVGFPTDGDDEGRANETVQGQYYLALRVLEVPFVYFEAFDQVWKDHLPIEPHWGLFTAERKPKKAMTMIIEGSAHTTVQFTIPNPGEKLPCTLGPDGGLCNVRGTAQGMDKTRTLLLFVDPQDPGVYGWFLQLEPNGVDLNPDGTWTGRVQIGNHDYPPKTGMRIGLMIMAVPVEEANKLVDTRMRNEALRNKGIRPQNLPKVEQEWLAWLKDVELDVR